MTEQQQPDGQNVSESEHLSVGEAAEEQSGSQLKDAPIADETEQQIATELVDGTAREQVSPAKAQETAEESRAGRFFKRVLRWVVMILVVFTLGVVAMLLVQVRPLIEERNDLNQSLAEAQAITQELQAELNRLEDVEAENQALSETLQLSEAKLALLDILVDVTRAQLALAQEDPVRVAAALRGTGEKLSALRDLIAPAASSDLEGVRERLVLVLSEVDGDPFAAERDLEILANTLLEIERELSGE